MAIKEKLSLEDIFFEEILTHPVHFAEFENNVDDRGVDWNLTQYQKEFICDFGSYVSMTCGRAVGKTWALSEVLLWLLTNNLFKGEPIAYTVPNKVHLDNVFNRLTIKLRSNSFLRNFIDPKKGINGSNYTIKMNNGGYLDCRIAGQSGTGQNVVGLHSPFIILDEAGFYPWGTWVELLPTLNTWEAGFRMIVSGVPLGMREKNVLYFADMVDDKFTKHRIAAHENPRYSDEDEERNIKQYGGVDSDDYIHFVLGRHGNPVFMVFDRRLMTIMQYPVMRLKINGTELGSDFSEYSRQISFLPAVPEDSKYCVFGIDLGYTDPTAIVILYKTKHDNFRFHCRIRLEKVPYPIQEKIIDYLDTKFNPLCIGIDEGAAGKSTVHHLFEDTEYLHKNYPKKMVAIDFASSIEIGKDADGKEIMERIKPYSVSLTQEYTNNHRIVYSTTDLDMISELERMTYTKSITGQISYRTLTERGGKRAEDHFTSALLCCILAYHQLNELVTFRKTKKLFGARWLYQ